MFKPLLVSSFALSLGAAAASLGEPLTSAEIRVDAAELEIYSAPDVARAPDGRYVVAWCDCAGVVTSLGLYVRFYNADGTPVAGPQRVLPVSTTVYPGWPSVGMAADGSVVVAWTGQDADDGGSLNIYFQRFAADGTALGARMRVHELAAGDQQQAELAMASDGRFVVTFIEFDQLSGYRMRGRAFNADGTPAGAQFAVSQTTADHDFQGEVALAEDGTITAVWTNSEQYSYDYRSYLRRFEFDGTPLADQVEIVSGALSSVYSPSVASIPGAGVVVSYTTATPETAGTESPTVVPWVQRYDGDGVALGSPVPVLPPTPGLGVWGARVAAAATGRFAVAIVDWADGDRTGIRLRRFEADGTPSGDVVDVNTLTLNHQDSGRIALDADGDAVIAWRHTLPWPSSLNQVMQRRYLGAQAVDLELDIASDGAAPSSTFTMNVHNAQPVTTPSGIPAFDAWVGAASGLRVTASFSAPLGTPTSTTPGWTCRLVGDQIACDRTQALAAGADAAVAFTVPITLAGETETFAAASADQPDPVPSTGFDVLEQTYYADLALTLAAQPEKRSKGSKVRFNYSLATTNALGAQGVTLSFTMPSQFKPLSALVGGTACAVSGQQFTCGVGTLAGGSAVSGVITVKALKAGTFGLTGVATTTSPEAVLGNNTATANKLIKK